MVVVNPYILPALAIPALCAFVFAMRYDPLRLHARFTRCLASGFVLLGAWNLMIPVQHIAFNPLTVFLSGWLGLPGAALSALLGML